MITKILVVAALAGGAKAPVLAQNAAAMTCDQLRYARKEIYARNGYCFKTERARATFGPAACRPTASCAAGKASASTNCECGKTAKAV